MTEQHDLEAVAAATAKRQQSEREWRQAILAAHAAGTSYRQIAQVAGVSYSRIAQVVRKG